MILNIKLSIDFKVTYVIEHKIFKDIQKKSIEGNRETIIELPINTV